MNISQNIVRLGIRQICTTGAARSAAKDVPKGYFELKKVQDRFQVKDGKPVFLKAGTVDGLMYRFTMGLAVVGLGGILKLLYDLSYPKPAE